MQGDPSLQKVPPEAQTTNLRGESIKSRTTTACTAVETPNKRRLQGGACSLQAVVVRRTAADRAVGGLVT